MTLRSKLFRCAAVICLWTVVPNQLVHAAPADLAQKTFESFKTKYPELSQAKAGRVSTVRYPSYWSCSDESSTLLIDINGNITYKRMPRWSGQTLIEQFASANPPAYSEKTADDDAKLIERTRELAKALLTDEQASSFRPMVKHEVLLMSKMPDVKVCKLVGRTLVRLYAPRKLDIGYFQAIFDPQDKLLRIDLQFVGYFQENSPAKSLFPASAVVPPVKLGEKPVTMGCFFCPSEFRFEVCALEIESERYFDVLTPANPFHNDNFDISDRYGTNIPAYMRSGSYHWYSWEHWRQYGRVGTFRGNWNVRNGVGTWDYPNQVVLHRSLATYGLVQGPPTETRIEDGPRNTKKKYPYGKDKDYAPAFFDDLEKCNVACFFTHGGLIDGTFQLSQQMDVWVNFMPKGRKLGEGGLRHIFLMACAGATYLKEPGAHLLETWIRDAQVDGLRTACAADGLSTGGEGSGWWFYGHYNKGDSVSDSWTLGMLDESADHFPVTIAYGQSPSDAMDTLLHGRFSVEKAGNQYIAISDWIDAGKTPPSATVYY